MRRHLARTALAAALGALVLTGAACSGDADSDADSNGLSAEVIATCDEYNRIINQWSQDYGAELGEVGQAETEGEEAETARKEEAVESVQALYRTAAADLRTQAGATSDQELSDGLTQAADGLVEIAEQIESYEDVEAAPELMSTGQFAEGGQTVNDICAG